VRATGWWGPLGVSLGAHAAILLALGGMPAALRRKPERSADALPVEVWTAVERQHASPAPQDAPRLPMTPRVVPRRQLVSAAALATGSPESLAVEADAREASDEESVGGRGTETGEAPAGVAAGTAGSGELANAVDLAALNAKLAAAAAECYPSAARRLRLTGEVELDFCAETDGRASSASIRGSTGSAVLDAAAQRCVLEHAVPLPVRAGCFRLPVRFGVR
jgi:periplasmic protein TonB